MKTIYKNNCEQNKTVEFKNIYLVSDKFQLQPKMYGFNSDYDWHYDKNSSSSLMSKVTFLLTLILVDLDLVSKSLNFDKIDEI